MGLGTTLNGCKDPGSSHIFARNSSFPHWIKPRMSRNILRNRAERIDFVTRATPGAVRKTGIQQDVGFCHLKILTRFHDHVCHLTFWKGIFHFSMSHAMTICASLGQCRFEDQRRSHKTCWGLTWDFSDFWCLKVIPPNLLPLNHGDIRPGGRDSGAWWLNLPQPTGDLMNLQVVHIMCSVGDTMDQTLVQR